jgi:hypothetical protein
VSIKLGLPCIYLCAIALLGSPMSGALAETQGSKKPAPPEVRQAPYSMEALLGLIGKSKTTNPVLPPKAVINLVKKRGVEFEPTRERLDQISKEAGSGPFADELIKAILEKAGVPAPPPASEAAPQQPPKPREGRLTVICKPVDCVVFADKTQIGTTTKGELKDHVLSEGKVTVSATSKDYTPDKQGQVVEIKDNDSVQVDFAFKVDPAALREKGNSLLAGMIAALGGEAALKEAGFFSANGRLDVHNKAKEEVKWPFSAIIKYPSSARFDISKNTKKYQVVKTDSGFSWKPNPKGQEFDELEDGLRLLLDNYITKLVDLLRGSGVKVEAEKLTTGPGEDVAFRVEREAYKYRVILNSESRPKEITLESGGLTSGLKILLSDYHKQAGAFIPMTTEVVLPGAGMRGVIVRYEKMDLNPSGVKDEDFKAKKDFFGRSR